MADHRRRAETEQVTTEREREMTKTYEVMSGDRLIIVEALPWVGPTSKGVHTMRLLVEVTNVEVSNDEAVHASWRLVETLSDEGAPDDESVRRAPATTGGFSVDALPMLLNAGLVERVDEDEPQCTYCHTVGHTNDDCPEMPLDETPLSVAYELGVAHGTKALQNDRDEFDRSMATLDDAGNEYRRGFNDGWDEAARARDAETQRRLVRQQQYAALVQTLDAARDALSDAAREVHDWGQMPEMDAIAVSAAFETIANVSVLTLAATALLAESHPADALTIDSAQYVVERLREGHAVTDPAAMSY